MSFLKYFGRIVFGCGIIIIVVCLVAILGVIIFRGMGIRIGQDFGGRVFQAHSILQSISSLAGIAAVFWVCRKFHGMNRRVLGVVFSKHSLYEAFLGSGLGFLSQLLWVATLVFWGLWSFKGFGWQFYSANSVLHAIGWSFVYYLLLVAFEEFLFRGYLLQALEEKIGIDYAVFISGILFGFFHVIINNIGLWNFVLISLDGILLGYAFVLYRSIWLPFFIHFSWDYSGVLFFHRYASKYLESSILIIWEHKKNIPYMNVIIPVLLIDIIVIVFLIFIVHRKKPSIDPALKSK